MKKITVILILVLSARLAIGQIVNGGFEVWDTTFTHGDSAGLISGGVLNPYAGNANHWVTPFGNCQTTDSRSGNFALILHNWYSYASAWAYYDDSISYVPLFLQGYFKYNKNGSHAYAQGEATVTLTRFNGTFNDTIAAGSCLFDSVAYYVPFQITLNYVSSLMPDSIHILIKNALYGSGWDIYNVNNLLYLDDLTLSNVPLGIENINTTEDFVTVFPSLVHDELNIRNNSAQSVQFSLYNSIGEKVFSESFPGEINKVDLSRYLSGIYFYKVNSGNKMQSGKIIKHQ